MATNFPASLDAFSNPAAGDATNNLTTPHATQHANANDAIEALEAKLGITASTPTASKVLRATGTGTSVWGALVNADVDAAAEIAMTKLRPYEFLAYVSSSVTNVTGDGTYYTILQDSELFDDGSNFAPGTGTFTAPVTGKYHFGAACGLLDLAAGHTQGWIEVVTSNRTYRGSRCNIGAMRDNGNVAALVMTVPVADMDAGDAAYVRVIVSNSTKVVDVEGNASILITYFGGYQVG